MKNILFILRVAIGTIFIASGFMKLMEPYQNFLAVIHAYQIVSGLFAKALAIGLPWVELVGGVFLLAGLWTRLCAFLFVVLNTAFIGALSLVLIRRIPIYECGCFGKFSPPLHLSLILDVILWMAIALLFVRSKELHPWSLDCVFLPKLHPAKKF